MGKIRIVTDSSAQFLDPSVVARYGITVVPQSITSAGQVIADDGQLDLMKFHNLRSGGLPAHLPPSVAQFEAVYGALRKESDTILSLHLSRAMSKTWDHAQQATQATLGRMTITVLDSMTCSVGLGGLVEYAAQLAERGDTLDQIARVIRKRTQTVYALFYSEDFETMQRGGLLSDSHAALGAMLAIKPFLTIEDGELRVIEKVRNRLQIIEKLVEFAAEFDAADRLMIVHGLNMADPIRQLTDRLAEELTRTDCPTVTYSPTLATFIGTEALGVMVYRAGEAP